MGTESLSAQIQDDSELAQSFHEFMETYGMNSKSEAVRTLVRDGLEAHDRGPADGSTTKNADSQLADLVVRYPFNAALLAYLLVFQQVELLLAPLGTFAPYLQLVVASLLVAGALQRQLVGPFLEWRGGGGSSSDTESTA